jgi:hypothetical protein
LFVVSVICVLCFAGKHVYFHSQTSKNMSYDITQAIPIRGNIQTTSPPEGDNVYEKQGADGKKEYIIVYDWVHDIYPPLKKEDARLLHRDTSLYLRENETSKYYS